MTNEKKSWFETLPGILTGIAAVIGAIASLYVALSGKPETKPVLETQPASQAPQVQPQPVVPSSPPAAVSQAEPVTASKVQPQPQTPPAINLNSIWHEIYPNPGNISHTSHDGDIFRFTIMGSIQGLRYQTTGTGTIKGRYIESTYRSTIPSTGRCAGSVSQDGTTITLRCQDSLNGQYETAWVRE